MGSADVERGGITDAGSLWAATSSCPPAAVPPGAQSESALPAVVDVRQVRRALTASEAENYLGDAACASCHADIAATHARSAHANTLRAVSLAQDGANFRHANPVKDSKSGFTYGAVIEQNRCQMLVFNKTVEATLPADYVLGSGHHAFSYLNRDDLNGWVAMRLSYYPQAKRWDFSAGQPTDRKLSTPMGIELDGPQVTVCLLCHTTVLRSTSPLVGGLNARPGQAYPDIAASRLGVGCERCHGPGRAHVQAVSRAGESSNHTSTATNAPPQKLGMEDLKRATPDQINTLCGYCHRTPQNTDPRDPHNELDTARFEGVALARSAYYQKSGTLSCVTCHEPHTDAEPSLARNDAVCLRCHTDTGTKAYNKAQKPLHSPTENTGTIPSAGSRPAAAICPVNPRDGCTRCHMPQETIAFGPGVRYTNHWIKHWIKVWPKEAESSRH